MTTDKLSRFGPQHATSLSAPATEGVVVVDSDFRVVGLDGGADRILRTASRTKDDKEALVLPPDIRQMVGAWPPASNGFGKATIELGNVEYRCCVFRVQPINEVVDRPVFALHLTRAGSINNSLGAIIESYHLTDRESEVLEGISLGLTSKMLAVRMNISPNTVNAFLRMIMIKLGVNTRAGIVGKLLEEGSSQNSRDTRMLRSGGRNA